MPYFGVPIRNGLPIGLGSQAGFGIAPFDPRDLFSAGEQGAWYDPSDYSTLFTDSAGTTPVTAVEQFVGLMLDKSKGLVLGPELVTNGDFSNGTTGFTKGDANSTFAVVNGQLVCNCGSTTNVFFRQTINTVAGRAYFISADIIALSAQAAIRFDSSTLGIGESFSSTLGTRKTWFIATGATTSIQIAADTANRTGTFDNISVRELPGNHATSTGTKRPKLAARYNLLTYSEQFDQGVWSKGAVTVTANVVVAPDGTTTADELVNTAVTNVHDIEQSTITPTIGTLYRITWRVKKSTNRYVALGWWRTTGSAAGAGFDLDTGTVTGTGAIGTDYSATNATIAALGNGWYEIGVTVTGSALLQVAALFHRATAYTGGASTFLGESYAGTTADKTFIWGADLRPASQATGLIGPTYQRVVDAATYDTAGFLPYLVADGVDDAMATNSINPGVVDKAQVFAGVRKLSDAADGMVAELSAVAGLNNGSFLMAFPGNITGVGPNMVLGLSGTAVAYSDARTYTAPITGVLEASFDIAQSSVADEIKQRVNGAIPSSITYLNADCGTGNFGTYPLFIGARNQTSLYFNGWIYSLIVRFGSNLTSQQIASTESWVASKSGVQL